MVHTDSIVLAIVLFLCSKKGMMNSPDIPQWAQSFVVTVIMASLLNDIQTYNALLITINSCHAGRFHLCIWKR